MLGGGRGSFSYIYKRQILVYQYHGIKNLKFLFSIQHIKRPLVLMLMMLVKKMEGERVK